MKLTFMIVFFWKWKVAFQACLIWIITTIHHMEVCQELCYKKCGNTVLIIHYIIVLFLA